MAKLKEISFRTDSVEHFLKGAVQRIVDNFDIEKIILFGSYAYGKPHKYSDTDLFIQMDSKERPAKRRLKIAQLFKEREIPMDFIVKTHSEVKRRLRLGDPFIKKIMLKGKILYEKRNS